MSTYKPGPWRQYKQQDHGGKDIGWRVEQTGTEIDICHVYGCPNAERHARLIASAPTMLIAMKVMLNCANTLDVYKGAAVLDMMKEIIQSIEEEL